VTKKKGFNCKAWGKGKTEYVIRKKTNNGGVKREGNIMEKKVEVQKQPNGEFSGRRGRGEVSLYCWGFWGGGKVEGTQRAKETSDYA